VRATGRTVEIWRADDATITPVTWRREGQRTEIPLRLDGEDAVFVVLRGATAASGEVATPVQFTSLAELSSGWHVAFDAAPYEAAPSALRSWHESTNPEIRYFSGTATYSNHFEVPATALEHGRLLLDLGEVHEVASVALNGRPAGIAWKPPYRLDVGKLLVPGGNVVEVTVANLWVNRLIGDAQPGSTARAFTTGPTYRADAPLKRSGLIGPVRLVAATRAEH